MKPSDDWRKRAACIEADPGLFYPDTPVGVNHRQAYAAAREVCGTCPVKLDCLEYAMHERETEGMWGGLTPLEREKVAKTRTPKQHRCTACGCDYVPVSYMQKNCSPRCSRRARSR